MESRSRLASSSASWLPVGSSRPAEGRRGVGGAEEGTLPLYLVLLTNEPSG